MHKNVINSKFPCVSFPRFIVPKCIGDNSATNVARGEEVNKTTKREQNRLSRLKAEKKYQTTVLSICLLILFPEIFKLGVQEFEVVNIPQQLSFLSLNKQHINRKNQNMT